MLLKSLTYPKAAGNPMREKVCRDVAGMLDRLGSRIRQYGGSSPAVEVPTQRRNVRIPNHPEEERRDRCRHIGQILCQARQERSLSREWLFSTTQVPVHQIRALEEGYTEELPEDVYLRGFIRKLGNALGLNGVELAASLPVQSVAVVPTWYHSTPGFNVQFSSAHFYFGYATLLLGAVGGLSWLSEWTPQVSLERREGSTLQYQDEKARAIEEAPVRAGANMAPPEMFDG